MKGPREASAARTPDGIEPLVGYRMWQPARRRGRGRLHSLNCSGPRWRFHSCPWEGAESSWVVASCTLRDRPSHVAPAENCSCGFYAMKTLEGLLWEMLDWMSAEDAKVLGRIELAGKIIEHEHGYRAERARIAELIPVQGTERDVMRLATGLGLPTGQPVAPRIFEPIPPSEATMRVLIVDDSEVTRAGLRAALEVADDIQIVGEAASGEEAVTNVERFGPDVVFMDVRMPGISGIEATREIRRGHPPAKVILFTVDDSQASISEAIRAGVSGYLLKDVGADDLVNAARLARQGKAVIHPALTSAVTNEARLRALRVLLSAREIEILERVAYGHSTLHVAASLSLEPDTVKAHLERVYEKLAATNQSHTLTRWPGTSSN
jgi:DNA-binding NarL/FixJ family response regulator